MEASTARALADAYCLVRIADIATKYARCPFSQVFAHISQMEVISQFDNHSEEALQDE